jgi:hypothetical protein
VLLSFLEILVSEWERRENCGVRER